MVFLKRLRQPPVTFLCEPRDEAVIAAPYPAAQYLPRWFRKLPAVDAAQVGTTDTGLTIKRCMPFLDAMTTGWIIPLAATVRLRIAEDGRKVDAGWDFDRTMVSNHGAHQVAGNPWGDRPPCKIHNYWTIRTPPGVSCLFINPMNRPNGLFEIVAGIVDTDTYAAPIHFPFFATGPDGLHEIEKGSPVAQVIPFRRDSVLGKADIRAERPAEAEERKKAQRSIQAAPGWYRTDIRAPR